MGMTMGDGFTKMMKGKDLFTKPVSDDNNRHAYERHDLHVLVAGA